MTEPPGPESTSGDTGGSGQHASPRDPRALLDRAGIGGDPRHDQHFLLDGRVLDRIVGYAEPFDCAHVLEIGPGTGALTDRLLGIADRVTAIERDRRLAKFVRDEVRTEVAADRLDVVTGDALEVEWPAYTVCVSNLPYSASSELLFELLPRGQPVVLLVQREFADRLVAEPGSAAYGRLTVTAGYYASIEQLEVVPPTVFEPPPPVDSAVIRGQPRTPTYDVPDGDRFLDFVTAVFTQRRKTMRNAIRNTTHISGLADPQALLEAVEPELLDVRPEQLAPEQFAAICQLAEDAGGWA